MKENDEKIQVVSFDVFDTLIKRSVPNPHDVFCLVERYCIENRISIPNNYKEKRIIAERTVNQLNNRPSTIQEIYEFFCNEFGGDPVRLEEVEKLVELNVCMPNLKVKDFYQECIQKKIRVIIISDMYFDSAFLKKILDNCGITKYEKIFVSCEYRATKTTGDLFEKVRSEIGIIPKQWLHIGDNPTGDIKSPQKLGIATYQVPPDKRCKYPIRANILNRLDFNMTNKIVDITSKSLNEREVMGARVLGPILAGFSKWLSEELENKGIHKVFFLSRDGFSMKTAFDLINFNKFETTYIFASRRSWTVPAIWLESDYEDILKNISMPPKTTVKNFLTRLGLVAENCLAEIQQCELLLESVINKEDMLESRAFRKLYCLIRKQVIDNSKREYDAVVKYLQDKCVNGKFAIVDIGYNGTMQKALKKILESAKIEAEIFGFYMGINPKSKLIRNHEIDAYSFLYGPGLNSDYQDKINAFISVFESIFLAQHGSTYRFKLDNDSSITEFYDYEYERQTARYVDEVSIIRDFQHGAMEYVKSVANVLNMGILKIDNGIAINNLLYMGLKPEKHGVELFADFRMFDTDISYIAHPDTLLHYLCSPSKLKKDFAASTWKIAFLYRLFKIPLSYEKIYYFLKKYIKS